jgi:hypothetical protein
MPKTETTVGQIPTHIREVRISAPGTAEQIGRLVLPLMRQFQEGEQIEVCVTVTRRSVGHVSVNEMIVLKRMA